MEVTWAELLEAALVQNLLEGGAEGVQVPLRGVAVVQALQGPLPVGVWVHHAVGFEPVLEGCLQPAPGPAC